MPAASLRRYRIAGVVLMDERSDGILLRAAGPVAEKLSWEDTAREMAASPEDWSAWNATAADGLDGLPWETGKARQVAESRTRYGVKTQGNRRS